MWPLYVGGAVLTTVAFALYVQFSSTMGGVWIRIDMNGDKVFSFGSLALLMVTPFRVWTPQGQMFWTCASLRPVNWPLLMMATMTSLACLVRLDGLWWNRSETIVF